jgi:hypothetical protein
MRGQKLAEYRARHSKEHPDVQTTWLLPSRCLQRVAAASTRQTHAYYDNAAKHASCHSTRAKAILPPGGEEKEQ